MKDFVKISKRFMEEVSLLKTINCTQHKMFWKIDIKNTEYNDWGEELNSGKYNFLLNLQPVLNEDESYDIYGGFPRKIEEVYGKDEESYNKDINDYPTTLFYLDRNLFGYIKYDYNYDFNKAFLIKNNPELIKLIEDNEDEFIPEEHMLKEDIQKNSYISEIITYKIIAQYIIDNLRAYYKIPNDEIIRVYVKSSNKSSDELLFTSNQCDRNEDIIINDEVVFEILKNEYFTIPESLVVHQYEAINNIRPSKYVDDFNEALSTLGKLYIEFK